MRIRDPRHTAQLDPDGKSGASAGTTVKLGQRQKLGAAAPVPVQPGSPAVPGYTPRWKGSGPRRRGGKWYQEDGVTPIPPAQAASLEASFQRKLAGTPAQPAQVLAQPSIGAEQSEEAEVTTESVAAQVNALKGLVEAIKPPPPGPVGTEPPGPAMKTTVTENPLEFIKGELPGLNWLPLALGPLSMLGALGKDPVFDRMQTSRDWRGEFKREFEGVSEDARTDPYQGKFFRNANRAALTSTNIMLQNNAQTMEKQRLAGGQLFAGGNERALAGMAPGFYANQGNLLAEGYNIRDRAVNTENQFVNLNTDRQQELFQFEVAQGTHSAYNRGMNLFNRALGAGMAGLGKGLDVTGSLFDLTTKKAMLEDSMGHYEGGGGTTTIEPVAGQPPVPTGDVVPGVPDQGPVGPRQSVLFDAYDKGHGGAQPSMLDYETNRMNKISQEALMGTPMSRRDYAWMNPPAKNGVDLMGPVPKKKQGMAALPANFLERGRTNSMGW